MDAQIYRQENLRKKFTKIGKFMLNVAFTKSENFSV